ncbi:type IX secretion system outer membrane channel protein PorV [Bacteroidota bacterium]
MREYCKVFLLVIVLMLVFDNSFGQNSNTVIGKDNPNAITSAATFLMIGPDSRAGGMGEAGVATSPGPNSMHWNPAKYAFIDGDMGISISYTPWLRNLGIYDINLAYISGYKRIDDQQVIGMSMVYFSLGEIIFTNDTGNEIAKKNPNEFAIDAAYSRAFSDRFSGSLAFRFIYSNITGGAGAYVGGVESHPGKAIGADVSLFYMNPDLYLSGKNSTLSFGLNISNIGSKISYTSNADKDFIPANLRLGGALKIDFDEHNSLAFATDLNKALVPTPPIYFMDSLDSQGNQVVEFGYDPNVSSTVALFRSFFDAPGVLNNDGSRNVAKEEFREIQYSIGMEYWYSNQFAIRGGYFHEHGTKGNRKFFTVGIGLKLNVFGLDFSYLIPVNQNNPLANTVRFSINFDMASLSN